MTIFLMGLDVLSCAKLVNSTDEFILQGAYARVVALTLS